jgi:hypothetical protein
MQMNKKFLGVFGVVSFCWITMAQAQQRPIVAVFDIDAERAKLDQNLVDALSDYVRTSVGLGKMYQVVPPNYVQQALKEKKKESYKTCYDQQCQIELGQELSANKTLSTKILKIGSICTVTMELYDLKKMASDSTATAEGECGEEKLMASAKKAVAILKGEDVTPVPAKQATTEPAASVPAPERKKTGVDAFLGVWDFLHSGNSTTHVMKGSNEVWTTVYLEKWVQFRKNEKGILEFISEEKRLSSRTGSLCEETIPGGRALNPQCGNDCRSDTKVKSIRHLESMNALEVTWEMVNTCSDGSKGTHEYITSYVLCSDGKKLVPISQYEQQKGLYSKSYAEVRTKMHLIEQTDEYGKNSEFTYAVRKEP